MNSAHAEIECYMLEKKIDTKSLIETASLSDSIGENFYDIDECLNPRPYEPIVLPSLNNVPIMDSKVDFPFLVKNSTCR